MEITYPPTFWTPTNTEGLAADLVYNFGDESHEMLTSTTLYWPGNVRQLRPGKDVRSDAKNLMIEISEFLGGYKIAPEDERAIWLYFCFNGEEFEKSGPLAWKKGMRYKFQIN